jgi:hypothetical protein
MVDKAPMDLEIDSCITLDASKLGPRPVAAPVDPTNQLELCFQKFGLNALDTKLYDLKLDFHNTFSEQLIKLEKSILVKMGDQQRQITLVDQHIQEIDARMVTSEASNKVLGEKFDQHAVEISDLREKLEAYRRDAEDMRRPDDGTMARRPEESQQSTPADRSFSNRIRFTGWAPFGSNEDCRINAEQYTELVKEIEAKLTPQLRDKLYFESPFSTNHQILARVLNATSMDDTFGVWREVEKCLRNGRPLTCRGKPVAAGVEPTKEIKRRYFLFHRAREYFEQRFPAGKTMACRKSMQIFTHGRVNGGNIQQIPLVKVVRADGSFLIGPDGCRELEVEPGVILRDLQTAIS